MANKYLQGRLKAEGHSTDGFVEEEKIQADIDRVLRNQAIGVPALEQVETAQQELARMTDEKYAARGVHNRPGA